LIDHSVEILGSGIDQVNEGKKLAVFHRDGWGNNPHHAQSAQSDVDADFLAVLQLVLLQPVTCDFRQSFVSKLIPTLFQAESSDCTPEGTKSTRSANSTQQLAPDSRDVLRSRKPLHD